MKPNISEDLPAADVQCVTSNNGNGANIASTNAPDVSGNEDTASRLSQETLVASISVRSDVSDVTDHHSDVTLTASELQLNSNWEKSQLDLKCGRDADLKPGEFVMRSLFKEFTVQAARKMDEVLTEPLSKPLSKVLQRGEDAQFDQIIIAFGTVSEHCLPSLLTTLFAWYEKQLETTDAESTSNENKKQDKQKGGDNSDAKDMELLLERRDLAVEFIFCLVLIEVLQQLPFHPGHEDLVAYIENIAFKHFKYKEGIEKSANAINIHTLADLYAEVISTLAQSRFQTVRKRFVQELKELRSKEANSHTTQSIISLLMGMKFFRVKMVPIEQFEASFLFMQDCAQYFLEVKDKDIKHALAGLFVEILVPVAATVKNEVNVPCLKHFVDSLYSQTLDMCTKSKHRLALFPLVTCLLCVSQKMFFLQNWHYFLAMCLSHLKNKDTKMSRVALESLYRLLWVYMIRIKCESNSATLSRLQSIVNSLFPKGSKAVVPRDTPLNIFVKIIQFISQERLDFAMREIVFDLLSVGRPIKMILTPERMSIGLRAFLVVADSLQQKEGEPPMPRTSGALPSGNTLLRTKKTFLNKMLTEDAARCIGMSAYFPHVKRVFVDILRALDIHYGRPLMMTITQNVNKEPDEMLTTERKPRIDLFRTCVAAVPRLIPETMTGTELVELLCRLTVHIDEELRALAYQSLQTLILDFQDFRHDVIFGITQFLSRDLQDTFPQLLDNGLRMLLQLLTSWKNAINSKKDDPNVATSLRFDRCHVQSQCEQEVITSVIHQVEGLALVMLCNCRSCPRRLSVHILKEAKHLLKLLAKQDNDMAVIDVLDRNCSQVLENCMHMLPSVEKSAILSANLIDLQWITERNSSIWTAGSQEEVNSKGTSTLNLRGINPQDLWSSCLAGFLQEDLLSNCPAAIVQAWPIVYSRLQSLFTVIDPTPVSDNRASLLRSSAPPKKPTTERDQYMGLWRNYLIFSMRVVPLSPSPMVRCASPDLSLSTSLDTAIANEKSETKLATVSPSGLYKLIVPLLRCETAEVRVVALHGLANINSEALKDLLEELSPYIREAIDKKQENMRRRRRRDALRLHLVTLFELIAENGTFGCSDCVLDRDTQCLHPAIVDYIEGARQCLEVEPDKEALKDIKLHFANFITKMINSFPLEKYVTLLKQDLRRDLLSMFANWSGMAGNVLTKSPSSVTLFTSTSSATAGDTHSVSDDDFQLAALRAMCASLYCGPCFEPKVICDETVLYNWLDNLLSSSDENIYEVALRTVILLLECNSDIGALLDWVVDRCYTAPMRVSDACFIALATVFSLREYPCDHYTAIINVTLMNTGCPRTNIREKALQLLQILDKRFFGSKGLLLADAEDGEEKNEKENSDNGALVNGNSCNGLLEKAYCYSQFHLSQQLSQMHPDLTMPMFSEITFRFQSARSDLRQQLLQYILPWLHNMELVDPNVPPISNLNTYYSNDIRRSGNHKECWGSAEATEMVLNNLFYITAKFSDVHPKEVEDVWATLCSCWANNLRVILRYLIIMSGMASVELLPFAKRVTLYLTRARPDRLLDEMLNELQTVETLNCLIERTETPPFYRLTSIRKISGYSEPDQDGLSHSDQHSNHSEVNLSVEKGTIHTKRHSGEDAGSSPSKASRTGNSECVSQFLPSCYQSPSVMKRIDSLRSHDSSGFVNDNKLRSFRNGPLTAEEGYLTSKEGTSGSSPQPNPLPMPEYGGYFAPLSEYLSDYSQPNTGYHRCNVAIMLLTDVVIDSTELDWSVHTPLILHVLFLGMDQNRHLVHQHCKQLLLNLLIAMAEHSDYLSVSQILLNCETRKLGLKLPIPQTQVVSHVFTDADPNFDSYLQQNVRGNNVSSAADLPSPNGSNQRNRSDSCKLEELAIMSVQEVAKSLIDYLAKKKDQVLWNYEDITAKVWTIRSVEQIDVFLQHVLKIFCESLPHALVRERWAQTALQLGLSCSSRHYAGRSLQLFRCLRTPISSRMLSDILSRLVETVSEQGEDMQGYVTELLLTLESAVDSLDSDFRSLDRFKDIFKSTPNLNNDEAAAKKTNLRFGNNRQCRYYNNNNPIHARSTSYSVACGLRKQIGGGASSCKMDNQEYRPDMESRYSYVNRYLANLNNSDTSLKSLGDCAAQDDKMTILAQLFWLAVSVLESDYEHEYLLALRLLNRVISRLSLDRPDAIDKIDKIYHQLRWNSFGGVHSLLLKGYSNPAIFEAVVPLLSKFTPFLHLSIVDPTQGVAFPMNVIALLPYMLLHYEDANELCITSAENIARVSAEKSKKLENLATVMTLYSRRTFSKESFQWTKCVVKYLHDSYAHVSINMLTFLTETLDKGPLVIQLPLLNIIHCLLHYVDFTSSPSTVQAFNSEVLALVSKFVEGPHYKEALKIVKLVVARSSSFVAAPSSVQHQTSESHYSSTNTMQSTFADVEVMARKELPGRTMDFTYDVSQTPIIGQVVIANKIEFGKRDNATIKSKQDNNIPANNVSSSTLHRRSSSLSPAENVAINWRRPWLCQSRVRECLVNLLTTCGQRVGLPKSPSVIFSQSSDLLERQSSVASSTEDASGQDLSAESKRNEDAEQFGIFKDFDFLEYESESVGGESADNFNWGVRRRPFSDGDVETDNRDSLSEKTPLIAVKTASFSGVYDSSDEEAGPESPLDENQHLEGASGSFNSLVRVSPRSRKDSSTHSDVSDSSLANLADDVTPCNASPNAVSCRSGLRVVHRDEVEDNWRFYISSLIEELPPNSLQLFHTIHKLMKEIILKSVTITETACEALANLGANAALQTHLTTISCILTARATPCLMWFDHNVITMNEQLRFGLLKLQEHLDTFFDRKDQVFECIHTLRTVLKLQEVSEDDLANDLMNEESTLDAGKALYKFHFQLLLLLESIGKMYGGFLTTTMQAGLKNISHEVSALKKALMKAQNEASNSTPEKTSSPSLLLPEQAESMLIHLLQEGKVSVALSHARQSTITPPSELVACGLDGDELTTILGLYCRHLIHTMPDCFIMIEEDLNDVRNSLMDELFQVLATVNEIERQLKDKTH